MPNGKALDRLHGLEKMRPTLKRKVMAHKLKAPKGAPECKEPCVMSAFQEWQDANLTPSWNYMLSFPAPPGKRLVIELVSALIQVPAGETARLQMYTGLPMGPSNLDLVVTPQGVVSGQSVYIRLRPHLRLRPSGHPMMTAGHPFARVTQNSGVILTTYDG